MADLGKMRFLKRFPVSKHAQIQQVMSYLQMCGLTGRDIVSIGGWIDRHAANEFYESAREQVQGYIDQKTIRPVGSDHPDQVSNRFRYMGITGNYRFVQDTWGTGWEVTSYRTKTTIWHTPDSREWPGRMHWSTKRFYNMVLDIADGLIQLNF